MHSLSETCEADDETSLSPPPTDDVDDVDVDPASLLPPAVDLTLRDLVRLLTTHPFIHRFLFNTDPVADLAVLNAPLSTDHAVAARLTTSVSDPSAAHHRLLDYVKRELVVSVPAFTTPAATLGLQLHHSSFEAAWPALYPSADTLHLTRYVHTPAMHVAVRRQPAAAGFDVCVVSQTCPKRLSTHTLSFNPTAFTPHHPPSVTHLAAALTSAERAELCRACPLCGCAPAQPCRCRAPPSHSPQDLLHLSQHHVPFFATVVVAVFAGTLTLDLFRRAHHALHASLDVSQRVAPASADAACEVVRRAVAQSLAVAVDPCAGLAPSLGRAAVAAGLKEEPRCSSEDSDAVQSSSLFEQTERLAVHLTQAQFAHEDDDSSSSADAATASRSLALPPSRKERNRLAAAKSNRKRKWRNKTMRLHLLILRQQLAKLREHENSLRSERVWLRQRCALHGVGGTMLPAVEPMTPP